MDPRLELLTGARAGDVLSAAVGASGGELVEWRALQVDHRPGTRTTVAHRAVVRRGDALAAETLLTSTGTHAPAGGPGVVLLGDGEHQVAVWRFPTDPYLPALAAAHDPHALVHLLGTLGIPVAPDARVEVRVRAYRPTRRAVLEVRAPGGRLFLKVVPPRRVADLHERHGVLHAAGVPVPRPLGWTADGLLVLEPLAGTPMRDSLRAGRDVPTGGQLIDLLRTLPAVVMDWPARRSWTQQADHFARMVGSVLPEERERAAQLAARIGHAVAGQEPDVPTHGDLHDGQVLLTGTRIGGLVDVDTVGPGRLADDLACLLAHAEVLALSSPAVVVPPGWRDAACAAVDPRELRPRVAGVLLSLATGPHRVQEPDWPTATRLRMDAVERWVDAVHPCHP